MLEHEMSCSRFRVLVLNLELLAGRHESAYRDAGLLKLDALPKSACDSMRREHGGPRRPMSSRPYSSSSRIAHESTHRSSGDLPFLRTAPPPGGAGVLLMEDGFRVGLGQPTTLVSPEAGSPPPRGANTRPLAWPPATLGNPETGSPSPRAAIAPLFCAILCSCWATAALPSAHFTYSWPMQPGRHVNKRGALINKPGARQSHFSIG